MNQSASCAVIGLGLIGSAWATHLVQDGVLAASWNRTPKPDAPKFEPVLKNIPKKASLLHFVVSDEKVLLHLLAEIKDQLTEHHTIIQSTTIDPASSDVAKSLVESCKATYIEAPFTGSLPAALERKLIYFLGGEDQTLDKVSEYLCRLSQIQFRVGSNRQACTLKLAMNLQIASAMTALAEGITACRDAEITDQVFFEVFKKNVSYSGVAALKEAKLREGDFAPQFSVKHMSKDMRLLSESIGDNFSILNAVREMLRKAEDDGFGDEDFSAVVKSVA